MEERWQPEFDIVEREAEIFGKNAAHDGESPAQLAKRLFEENTPDAALTIIKLVKRGSSERVRLDASKYLIDKVMGKDPAGLLGQKDSDDLMNAVNSFLKAE